MLTSVDETLNGANSTNLNLEDLEMGKKKSVAHTETNGEVEKAVSKMAGVRKAIEAGVQEPDAIVAYVKEHFGLELDKNMASTYKSTILNKGGGKRARKEEALDLNDLLTLKNTLKERKINVGGLLTKISEVEDVAAPVGGISRLKKGLEALNTLSD